MEEQSWHGFAPKGQARKSLFLFVLIFAGNPPKRAGSPGRARAERWHSLRIPAGKSPGNGGRKAEKYRIPSDTAPKRSDPAASGREASRFAG